MKVILTEKPSVARDIAKCLQINAKRDGYYEGHGYQITWAYGHLVELKEPDDYHPEWKRWSLATLPMIPDTFGLKARGDELAQKQLAVIKRLFVAADELVCATDAGREGELIFRYIQAWTQCAHKPFKRLWISSLTDEAIRQGFAKLQDGSVFDGLYRAAKCRSEADWIVGLNATRWYTLSYAQQGGLWTLGRVQTPVLAMIVQKDAEIAEFVPKDFWELHTCYREADFHYVGGRFDQQAAAEALFNQVTGALLTITSVQGKREFVYPPLLYDLTELQKDMSIRYGFTAEHTLSLAQQLYEKKHSTYPRTDSRYLSHDMKAGMKALLEKLRQNFAVQIAALNLEQLVLGNRYFNDTKVTDHHAIIPTLVLPGSLSADEHKVYTAIVLRFIASFYPPCSKQITTVLAEAAQLGFKTTGTVIESAGWQVLFQDEPKAVAAGDPARPLPRFLEGETGAHTPAIKAGKTTPPKPYNEASLLAMMESAGKTCGDEALKAALKEKGLGTPATRAAIIEVLIKRNYIHRQKKLLLSTESGRQLIALIHDERLKSAAMTGEWEAKLKQMEQQRYDPEQFMAEIGQFTRALITTATVPVLDGKDLGLCPLCQHPIIEGRQGYGCSAWKSGCQFVLWKQAYGLTVSRAMAAQLLQSGVSQQAYALKIDGQSVYAKLSLNGQGELAYQPQAAPTLPPDTTVLADCPLCNGKIVETAKAYSCSEWRNGCKVVIWKTIADKKITPAMAIKLLKTGETAELKGFKSAKGTIFSARLKLVAGKVTFNFGGQ